jgi:hypothetical protein
VNLTTFVPTQAQATDALGSTRFDFRILRPGGSYRARFQNGNATFWSDPFTVPTTGNVAIDVTAWPLASNPTEAGIVSDVVFAIHRKGRDLVFDMIYLMHVRRQLAWSPSEVALSFPTDWTAFTTSPTDTDRKFERLENGQIRLLGTFPPGKHEFSFRAVLKDAPSRYALTLPLLPSVGNLRVVADTPSFTTLTVDGHDPAQATTMKSGQVVLYTQRMYIKHQEQSPSVLLVTVDSGQQR